MMCAFAGEESFAEQEFRPLKNLTFDVAGAGCDEDVLDKIGAVQQIKALPSDTKVAEVSILLCDPQKEFGRMPPIGQRLADDRPAIGAGWSPDGFPGHIIDYRSTQVRSAKRQKALIVPTLQRLGL